MLKNPRHAPQIVQARLEAARRTRERKVARRQYAVLSGDWGHSAQIAEWDRIVPTHAECLDILNGRRNGALTAAEHGLLDRLSTRLNADGRRLARPWYRLLMQDQTRRHHVWMAQNGKSIPWRFRWGGYPLR